MRARVVARYTRHARIREGFTLVVMGKKLTDDTEFGGVPGQPFPAEKGYVQKDWETLRDIYRADPMDPDAGSEITTERVK